MSNAVKAKSWFQRFSLAYTLHGGPPARQREVVAVSQTIIVGDPLTKSTGEVSKGAANSGAIYGIANGNVTTTAADEKTELDVILADRQNVFVAQAEGQTDAIEDLAECDIIASGSSWLIDEDASTEDVVMIVKHVPGDSESDDTDPGRMYFIWKRSQWDLLVAAR